MPFETSLSKEKLKQFNEEQRLASSELQQEKNNYL
jgi:hypothetical protein